MLHLRQKHFGVVLLLLVDTVLPKQNCYERLGVSPKASDREIKKGFRKKAMKFHPDRTQKLPEKKRERAEKLFQKLANCNEILSDKDKRKQYDASGYNADFEKSG